ncbi:pro-MCH isoform X2 [Dunckerocampus dactyliophorus]|uniref:pro-MCH isoform X2 n=1 Tax=Dunckerocampus dactyliophorus TaxID=161453 RepID=UPI002404E984|nr:pro-MCH isoform X2 [Dunckerocampus dactyliophorus]
MNIMSVHCVLLTLLLFSSLSRRLAAIPQSQRGDEGAAAEKDGPMGPLLLDNEAGFRRNLVWDDVKDEDGGSRIVFLADTRRRAARFQGSNPALERSWSHTPADNMKVDRRDTDIEVLRCMVGRVYRPCWGT